MDAYRQRDPSRLRPSRWASARSDRCDCRRLRRRSRRHRRQSSGRHHRRPARTLRDEVWKGYTVTIECERRLWVPLYSRRPLVFSRPPISSVQPRYGRPDPERPHRRRNRIALVRPRTSGSGNGRVAAIGPPGPAPRPTQNDRRDRPQSSRPGFIDMLGQSELTVLVDPPPAPRKSSRESRPSSTGEGGSAAPLNDAIIKGGTKSITTT